MGTAAAGAQKDLDLKQISRSEARHLERKSEERAEALAGTFTAQGVANSLSAYVALGREPGGGRAR
jgi:hypothetical protein